VRGGQAFPIHDGIRQFCAGSWAVDAPQVRTVLIFVVAARTECRTVNFLLELRAGLAHFFGRDLREVIPMRKIPQAIYLCADEIEQLVRDREAEADALPDGDERQAILKEIAQLRLYADAKRWIESPGLKPGA
jgi:hypothetical protein